MEIGWFMWSLKSSVLLALISVIFACSQRAEKSQKFQNPAYFNKIQTGDLICRKGNGFFSDYFRRYASKEQKYSHIGIILREQDSLYVYHAEASELSGVGFVKKEAIASFLQDIELFDFFRADISCEQKEKVMEYAHQNYLKKTVFDLSFNSCDDAELYCTELVAKALNKALKNDSIVPSLYANGKMLYGLDDIYANSWVTKIDTNLSDFFNE